MPKTITNPQDLRVVRTRQALSQSLFTLLHQKPFEDISVSEICQMAMVRRATFYLHFGDKFGLLSYAISSIQAQFLANSTPIKDDANNSPLGFYLAMIEQCFEYFEENHQLIHRLMCSSCANVFVALLTQYVQDDVWQHFENDRQQGRLHGDATVMAAIFSGALVRTLTHHVSTGKCQKSAVMDGFAKLLAGFYRES